MLEGRNFSYTRGGRSLFSTLSFCLREGEMLAVKGANGSGKSTFLRLVAGLILPPPATLYWNDAALTSQSLSFYQQNLLYVGHKLCLHPEALVKDQIRLWQNLYGLSEKVIEDALAIWGVGVLKNKKISHLSQGQQKRLSLSRCSWLDRPLWILDEPQAGLDQTGKATLSHVLVHHRGRGGSVIIATHDPLPVKLKITQEENPGLLRPVPRFRGDGLAMTEEERPCEGAQRPRQSRPSSFEYTAEIIL